MPVPCTKVSLRSYAALLPEVRRWIEWTDAWSGIVQKDEMCPIGQDIMRVRIYIFLLIHVAPLLSIRPDFQQKSLAEILQGFDFQVIRLGLEPRTPSLKGMCSTCWASESFFKSGGKGKDFFVKSKSILGNSSSLIQHFEISCTFVRSNLLYFFDSKYRNISSIHESLCAFAPFRANNSSSKDAKTQRFPFADLCYLCVVCSVLII